MARFDKYDPVSGGFRAKLGDAIVSGDVGGVIGVRIDTNGLVKKGTGATTPADVRGVICPTRTMAVGDPIDVMTSGEIVDVDTIAGTGLTAGEVAYVNTTSANSGLLTDSATTNAKVGHMVEAWRLIVRLGT